MNAVGYLVTLANLQLFGGPDRQLKDMTVKIADLPALANDLKDYPQFNLESFRKNGFSRVGDIGMYLSSNLRQYLYYRYGNPSDEGTIIILFYEDREADESNADKPDLTALSYLIRKEGFGDDNLHSFLGEYLKDKDEHRLRRYVGQKKVSN